MRSMKNRDIRDAAGNHRIFLYEVAPKVGLSYQGLMCLLRKDITAERRKQILDAIDQLAAERK